MCLPKEEGGLGIRPLKEINVVLCLKLIWRIISNKSSLWVKWIQCYLIRKGSFWSIKDSTVSGFWMWKKLLKLRELAMSFLKMEVNNGRHTYFWYDTWSRVGCLKNHLRDGGSIVMGVRENDYVVDVLNCRRRRRHKMQLLNNVEEEIEAIRNRASQEDDVPLWRKSDDKYAKSFSTKATWVCLRQPQPCCNWYKGIWFPHSTPKYSFLIWVATKNRLQTSDRIRQWNSTVDDVCVLCHEEQETCQHLFFKCRYSRRIWKEMVGGIMKERFTTDWFMILDELSQSGSGKTEKFLIRYAFQTLAHCIWRERNARRHGKQAKSMVVLSTMVDKMIRLKLLLVKGLGKQYLEESLVKWFESRI